MEQVLRTYNLTKTYKNVNAVDNLNINVGKGDIYGFLGKNGAGKTTTIKMIMGLLKVSSGEIELFGNKILDNKCYGRIGSLIDYPGFYLNLTGEENLEIHRRMIGFPGKDSIHNALEMVGLKNIERKKVKNFSLGMKQRLGIARALLHHPEFLILDEPTNGLDPIGIKEIRDLILNLNKKYEITVLISSHILSEVQLLATKIGIIHKGRLLEEISYDELQKRNRHYIQLKVDNDKKASFLLEKNLEINDYVIWEDGIIRVYEKLNEGGNINKTLVSNDVRVEEIYVTVDNLEDYFIRLTGGESYV
ncbi:bacitracin transport system ATP-binding protein [Clostridium tetanomorphum]|uniref:ABC transporter ATP-binding protein n=1 Tax=Clostridium tetanomorphum TaxID=1553 RepID=A0A923J036_CLOTT|nr:ABC transporter ATP-binding protein [Clostridium tetanomorphum]KAJ50973.1 bacitracin transport ATP-binding protein bcrA [Clostridium tetanomorphum DSM 665]MBC2396340.1 ABC transporter ATP-binding protein [Clostridium tetanomorphum]MBP1863431.1 bacitracin transport system ATP-binding protein [Clostridium tetanomorphum]NRS83528.1 bacitracin transport system ATP-binding protein [Clostridium tetanomorphum]NRZ96728.1 bacitracin transport system ATP-binding protein [Clostridium tetanomorphum]